MLPDFRVSFHAARPTWEKGRLESCAELMKPGMTVFDIGAEHGDFTALYRKWVGTCTCGHPLRDHHPTGEFQDRLCTRCGCLTHAVADGDVIPIEPAAHYWPFIRGTFEANEFPAPGYWYQGLVSDKWANTPKHVWTREESWPNAAYAEGVPDGGFIHVKSNPSFPQITIDRLSELATPPHAIVLDIEGAELLALQGAANTLQTHRPLVWVSVHDIGDGAGWNGPLKDWYSAVPQDIHDYMNEMDYSAQELPYMGEGEHFWLYTPR